MPRLGNWSPLLDEMDPFRDGRGAERMETYFDWLIKGFDQGLNRDTVLQMQQETIVNSGGTIRSFG